MYPNYFFQKHFSKLTHCLGFLFWILIYSNLEAQTPGLSYQALVYDDEDNAFASQSIQLKFLQMTTTIMFPWSLTVIGELLDTTKQTSI